MQVILIKNVPGIGKIDDIKEVSEGYARNFLFARNLAQPATAQVVAELKSRQNKQIKDYQLHLNSEQSLADKLRNREFIIKEKVSDNGALYAAVGPQKISEALALGGFKIDKDQILFKPIKETGKYKAKIKFQHGLEAEINIIVSKI